MICGRYSPIICTRSCVPALTSGTMNRANALKAWCTRMADRKTLTDEQVAALREYTQSKTARAAWTKHEKRLKEHALYGVLGYTEGDEKPPDMEAVDQAGNPVATVTVAYRRGLDVPYLREKYPEIYAECEKWTPAISVKDARGDVT